MTALGADTSCLHNFYQKMYFKYSNHYFIIVLQFPESKVFEITRGFIFDFIYLVSLIECLLQKNVMNTCYKRSTNYKRIIM